jgi:hypothetical protein
MATPGTLSHEALSYYAQMGIPVPQQQQPDLSSYAPQPAQQAAPQLRPSPARQEYVNLIQSRMQELIQQAGGAERVARLGLMEVAQKKAMEDVAMLYGEAPAIERPQAPIRVEPIPGTNQVMVMGGGMSSPQFIEAAQPAIPQATAVPLINAATGKPVPGKGVMDGKVVDLPSEGEVKINPAMLLQSGIQSIDELIGPAPSPNETEQQKKLRQERESSFQSATGMSGSFYQALSNWGIKNKPAGIRKDLEIVADKVGAIGASLFENQGSFSDAERASIKAALSGINLSGTDEQALKSVRNLQNLFNELAAKRSGSGEQMTPATQSGPTRRVFIPGKGFQ